MSLILMASERGAKRAYSAAGGREPRVRGGIVRATRTASLHQMMKIQVDELDGGLVIKVEGRLAGAFVPELENCWKAARANRPNRNISVDLKNVTCVDRTGRTLLQSMHHDGVGFLRAGIAIQDILEQIMEQQECKH